MPRMQISLKLEKLLDSLAKINHWARSALLNLPNKAMTEAQQDSQSNLSMIFYIILSIIKKVVMISVLSVPVLITYLRDIFVDKKTVTGWTVLITGGVNGIGRFIASEFAKCGCNIAILDTDGEAAREAALELKKYNIKAVGYQVDVCNAKSVEQIKDVIEKDIAPVDILVNSADILPSNHTLDEKDKDIERLISVNMKSQIYATRAFLPGMIERKRGHIVTVSSITAHHESAFSLLHSSTKFGANEFALSIEEELRQEGLAQYIKCTILYPLFVESRNDMDEWANFIFPELDPVEAAEKAVTGILKNRREVYMPCYLCILIKLSKIMPYGIVALFRNYIIKEKEIYKRLVAKYLIRCNVETKLTDYLKFKQ